MNSERTIKAFFEAYDRQDVVSMAALCDDGATIRHVAGDFRRTQRFERSEGHVVSVGRTLWIEMMTSFQQLRHRIEWIAADRTGSSACRVVATGHQVRPFLGIPCLGRNLTLPALYVFRQDSSGLIRDIAVYWDGSELRSELAASVLA